MESVQVRIPDEYIGILKELSETLHSSRSEVIRRAMEEEIVREALNSWIQVLDFKGDPVEFRKYGLDRGEASLFLVAAIKILNKLTIGDFRLTSDLYVWACEEISRV